MHLVGHLHHGMCKHCLLCINLKHSVLAMADPVLSRYYLETSTSCHVSGVLATYCGFAVNTMYMYYKMWQCLSIYQWILPVMWICILSFNERILGESQCCFSLASDILVSF